MIPCEYSATPSSSLSVRFPLPLCFISNLIASRKRVVFKPFRTLCATRLFLPFSFQSVAHSFVSRTSFISFSSYLFRTLCQKHGGWGSSQFSNTHLPRNPRCRPEGTALRKPIAPVSEGGRYTSNRRRAISWLRGLSVSVANPCLLPLPAPTPNAKRPLDVSRGRRTIQSRSVRSRTGSTGTGCTPRGDIALRRLSQKCRARERNGPRRPA